MPFAGRMLAAVSGYSPPLPLPPPEVVGFANGTPTTGALSVPLPTVSGGLQDDDLLLLVINQDGSDGNSIPSGWANTGVGGSSSNQWVRILYRYYDSASPPSDPTVTGDEGAAMMGGIVAVRYVRTDGTASMAGSTNAIFSSTPAAPSVSATAADAFYMAVLSGNNDTGISGVTFGSNLSDTSRVYEANTSLGGDITTGIATGLFTTSGSSGATSWSLGGSVGGITAVFKIEAG